MYKCVNGHTFCEPFYFGHRRDEEFTYDKLGCPRCGSIDYTQLPEEIKESDTNVRDSKEA